LLRIEPDSGRLAKRFQLAVAGGPLGLDFDDTDFTQRVVPKAAPFPVLGIWKKIINVWRVEQGLPPVTAEGDEVGLFGFVESVQSARHEKRLRLATVFVCDVPGLGQKRAEPGAPRGFLGF
jgi:hypothetical protein